MTKPTEIYVSTDIEADGPIPGPYSMLSFASAAYVVQADKFAGSKLGQRSEARWPEPQERYKEVPVAKPRMQSGEGEPQGGGEHKTLLSTYSANLETLAGAGTHPKTMEWWQQFPDAWAACRRDVRPPETVMPEYLAWLAKLPGRPVFLGWPASWDFMWVYWYIVRFTGERPFRENALDVRSYAMGMRKSEFRLTSRTYLPKRWFDANLSHTHVALDDALEQGALFCNMHAENLKPPD